MSKVLLAFKMFTFMWLVGLVFGGPGLFAGFLVLVLYLRSFTKKQVIELIRIFLYKTLSVTAGFVILLFSTRLEAVAILMFSPQAFLFLAILFAGVESKLICRRFDKPYGLTFLVSWLGNMLYVFSVFMVWMRG